MNQTEEGGSESIDAHSDGTGRKKLDLSASEVNLLLKACQRYRVTIPSYLQSKQAEFNLIERLIQKLSK